MSLDAIEPRVGELDAELRGEERKGSSIRWVEGEQEAGGVEGRRVLDGLVEEPSSEFVTAKLTRLGGDKLRPR